MARYAGLFDSTGTAGPGGEAASPTGEKMERRDRFTLLFVDDEPNVLSGLRRVFHRENYDILTATSGEEALRLMEAHPVQLIITDYKMPRMLGSDLLKQVKESWPETIRIMLTGHADVQAIMGAVNEGAVYKFITKPCNDDDLRLTVSLALEQYTLIQENRKLRRITSQQQNKIRRYSSVFDESRGLVGRILVEARLITPEQLAEATAGADKGDFLGDILVSLGYVTEDQVAQNVARSQGLPCIDLKEMRISPELIRLLPRDLCEKNRLLPIRMNQRRLTVAMADPSDLIKIDNIAMWTSAHVDPVVAKSSDILQRIAAEFGEKPEEEEVWDPNLALALDPMDEIDVILDEDDLGASLEELVRSSRVPPIVRIVNAVIGEALRNAASDIHVEPRPKHSVVRYRMDGMLNTKIRIPPDFHAPTVSRVKILAKMDVAERRMPQDGRFTVKTGTQIADIRVSTIPTINGEKVVMRILDKTAEIKRASDVGMLEADLARLEALVRKPQGMVISTGPTGSGKTTTLYSILHGMLDPARSFETIEDPVEYFLEEVNQVHVREQIGMTFATALRATLRQDPDVILLGEIRDMETADAAFKAALTGHVVLTTLHTANSVATITRLIDIGVKPYVIASALEGVIAQRLIRKVCAHCKITGPPDAGVLGLLCATGEGLDTVVTGKGCRRCNQTGYAGRIGIFELLVLNDQFRQCISSTFREAEVMTLARTAGMRTLREDGLEKVRRGITTLEEVLRVLGPPSGMKQPCSQCNQLLDTEFSYCPHCGTYRRTTCRECRMPLDESWKLCPTCGSAREQDPGMQATAAQG